MSCRMPGPAIRRTQGSVWSRRNPWRRSGVRRHRRDILPVLASRSSAPFRRRRSKHLWSRTGRPPGVRAARCRHQRTGWRSKYGERSRPRNRRPRGRRGSRRALPKAWTRSVVWQIRCAGPGRARQPAPARRGHARRGARAPPASADSQRLHEGDQARQRARAPPASAGSRRLHRYPRRRLQTCWCADPRSAVLMVRLRQDEPGVAGRAKQALGRGAAGASSRAPRCCRRGLRQAPPEPQPSVPFSSPRPAR